ncbi:hypothetical protein HDU93_007005 [Gonapodya sp. JEL0774]|nr:hypothetical protein HDU93_007005 [Gonapodya sp. JEL0774]
MSKKHPVYKELVRRMRTNGPEKNRPLLAEWKKNYGRTAFANLGELFRKAKTELTDLVNGFHRQEGAVKINEEDGDTSKCHNQWIIALWWDTPADVLCKLAFLSNNLDGHSIAMDVFDQVKYVSDKIDAYIARNPGTKRDSVQPVTIAKLLPNTGAVGEKWTEVNTLRNLMVIVNFFDSVKNSIYDHRHTGLLSFINMHANFATRELKTEEDQHKYLDYLLSQPSRVTEAQARAWLEIFTRRKALRETLENTKLVLAERLPQVQFDRLFGEIENGMYDDNPDQLRAAIEAAKNPSPSKEPPAQEITDLNEDVSPPACPHICVQPKETTVHDEMALGGAPEIVDDERATMAYSVDMDMDGPTKSRKKNASSVSKSKLSGDKVDKDDDKSSRAPLCMPFELVKPAPTVILRAPIHSAGDNVEPLHAHLNSASMVLVDLDRVGSEVKPALDLAGKLAVGTGWIVLHTSKWITLSEAQKVFLSELEYENRKIFFADDIAAWVDNKKKKLHYFVVAQCFLQSATSFKVEAPFVGQLPPSKGMDDSLRLAGDPDMQVPITTAAYVLNQLTKKEELIIDLGCGAAGFGVAALLTNCKYIGIKSLTDVAGSALTRLMSLHQTFVEEKGSLAAKYIDYTTLKSIDVWSGKENIHPPRLKLRPPTPRQSATPLKTGVIETRSAKRLRDKGNTEDNIEEGASDRKGKRVARRSSCLTPRTRRFIEKYYVNVQAKDE